MVLMGKLTPFRHEHVITKLIMLIPILFAARTMARFFFLFGMLVVGPLEKKKGERESSANTWIMGVITCLDVL